MLIKVEELTSKNIINFSAPIPMTGEENCILLFSAADNDNDFFRELFEDNGITRCLVAGSLLSVQYASGADKENLKALVLACMDEYIDHPDCFAGCKENAGLAEKCEAVADALIRPTLNRDKGDIAILSVQNGNMEVRFTGHCAGCPYAQNTLQNVIVRTFKRYLPQIKDIKLKE